MGENLLYCVNTVVPIFLLVLLGWVFRRIGLLSDAFFDNAEKFVFRVALPCNLFLFVLLMAFVPLFIKDNGKRGAFIQGVHRSNFAILGVPLAERLFPETGRAVAASLMPFTITLFNVFAVVALTVFSSEKRERGITGAVCRSFAGIVKNPLIIGILLGVPFMLIEPLRLPVPIYTCVDYLSSLTTPLALMCLGASVKLSRLSRNAGAASVAAALKVALVPAVFVTSAALLGFRGVQLGAVLVLFGAPTAVSSFIMAKNMKSDHALAGQILLITTVMCLFTLFAGIYILRTLSLI